MLLEVIEDDERTRADIQVLNTGLAFAPINTVRLDDLEVVEVSTKDLIGHYVTINKVDYSQVDGKFINVSEQKLNSIYLIALMELKPMCILLLLMITEYNT